jgi:hypothetical protein
MRLQILTYQYFVYPTLRQAMVSRQCSYSATPLILWLLTRPLPNHLLHLPVGADRPAQSRRVRQLIQSVPHTTAPFTATLEMSSP